MRKSIRIILAAALLLACLAGSAGGERSRQLESALRFLEADNPLLRRYNEIKGTDLQARWPLGCPYFWGGRHVTSVLRPASPNGSSDYYKKENTYLYGMDCIGFTRWVVKQGGYEEHPAISELLNRSKYTEYAVRGTDQYAGAQLAEHLRIGDLAAIRHPSGGYHIAMFCGTLSDFGYTADSVSTELAPYLDYPLLIHCTGSSDYYLRYRDWLAAQGETEITPPFGGVIVTILDVPAEAAPGVTMDAAEPGVPCFDLEGYHLQITDLTAEKQHRWIRWRKRPEKGD